MVQEMAPFSEPIGRTAIVLCCSKRLLERQIGRSPHIKNSKFASWEAEIPFFNLPHKSPDSRQSQKSFI